MKAKLWSISRSPKGSMGHLRGMMAFVLPRRLLPTHSVGRGQIEANGSCGASPWPHSLRPASGPRFLEHSSASLNLPLLPQSSHLHPSDSLQTCLPTSPPSTASLPHLLWFQCPAPNSPRAHHPDPTPSSYTGL